MDVDELTHAVSVVHGGAAVGDLDVAPAPIRIEGDEEIDGAVAAILVIVALALSRAGTGWRTSLISWTGVSSKIPWGVDSDQV